MPTKGDTKEKVRSKRKEDSKAEKSKAKKDAVKTKKDAKEKSTVKSGSRRKESQRNQAEDEAKERRDAAATAAAKKRKAEDATGPSKEKKKKSRKDKETSKSKAPEAPSDRRVQGGAADAAKAKKENKENGKDERTERKGKEANDKERQDRDKRSGAARGATGACAAEALDGDDGEKLQTGGSAGGSAGGSSGSRPPASKSRSPAMAKAADPVSKEKADKADKAHKRGSDSVSDYDSESATSGARRRKRREEAGLKAASGFGLAPPPPAPDASGPVMYGPSSLMPLPDKVKGLLEHKDSLAQEVLRMKMAVEAATGQPSKVEGREEPAETTLKMPTRLTECLMDPANHAKLLIKTGLLSATLNEEKHLVLRAPSPGRLKKTLGHLRRIAWACQWGCSSAKVFALLAERPAKPLNSIVLRLAATSSRLSSHDAKLSAKMRKLRMGTQAGPGMLVLEGITGLSRKHCTITFEPDKGACYVQDVSTNGTYLNGKRLPRPPYKNPSDARVRLFHGDELLFKLRSEDAEELGYVINLVELS
ncbi:Prdx6 [Symbiodinium natans]|uniref:Prdx6 protein n=1 Tax=Symbiodinium natans TaxID=878477 RepID=A0A812T0M0_9DINO|nr:Prdx6 [Symbiodinium natans]